MSNWNNPTKILQSLEGYKKETMREKRQTSLGGPRAQISGWKNRAPKLD